MWKEFKKLWNYALLPMLQKDTYIHQKIIIKGTRAQSFGLESIYAKILFIHKSQSRNVMLNL